MPSPPAIGFEQRLADAIARRISEPRFNLWFRDHTRFVPVGDGVVVGVPNQYFQDWLQKTFGADVRAAAAEVLGAKAVVRFAIDAELFQGKKEEAIPRKEEVAEAAKEAPPKRKAAKPQAAPEKVPFRKPKPTRRWRSLADFVVGQCNRVAHASAQSVVDEPGAGANPLVLYGPTGTGKTHLLEGVYTGLRRRHPELRVVYVSAEEFMNRFVAALQRGTLPAFRKQFRECSALLVDNLSFLAGTTKNATKVEFLHTFDALVSDGAQVVVTCDCHPRLAEDLMPELADRLLGGAIWSLLPPDPQTRLDLLQAKAAGSGPAIPNDVLQFLAGNLRGNVRELEGAIHSLRHYARVSGQPVTKDLAREALGDLLRHAVRVVRVADVEAAVVTALKLPPGAMRSKSKAWAVSHARMLAIYLARKHTAATYGEISAYFGNKTHSTAVAAEKKVRGWLASNEAVRAGDRAWRARDLLDKVERELQR